MYSHLMISGRRTSDVENESLEIEEIIIQEQRATPSWYRFLNDCI